MTDHSGGPDLLWEKGWDGHEEAQLLRMAKLPLEQKIRWLEEAQELMQSFEQSRKRRQKDPNRP